MFTPPSTAASHGRFVTSHQAKEIVMFSKSILLAIALGVTAIASGTAPASASHSQPYPGYRVAPMTRPHRIVRPDF